jgi:hypothetical protein
MNLTSSERHFLGLLVDGGSISIGSAVGAGLYSRGLVDLVRHGRRYGITQAGDRGAAWRRWNKSRPGRIFAP